MSDDIQIPVGRGAERDPPERKSLKQKPKPPAAPKVKPTNGLSLDEMAFALEFIKYNDEGKAARAVWPNHADPVAEGIRISRRPAVKKYLQLRRLEKLQAAELSVDYVLSRFKRLADANIQDLYRPDGTFIPVQDLHPDVAASIASIEVEVTRTHRVTEGPEGEATTENVEIQTIRVKRWDTLKALDALAKWFKMFDENGAPPASPPAMNAITTTDQVTAAREYQKLIAG